MQLPAQPNAVMTLGLSAIRKEYAQKIEHLATVQDGSTGGVHQGYRLCDVTAAEVEGSEIVLPDRKLFSVAAKVGSPYRFEVLRFLLGALWRATHVSSFSLDRRTT